MGPDRLPGPQPTFLVALALAGEGELLVGDAVAACDQRTLALLRPGRLAAERGLERVVARRRANDHARDRPVVPEGEVRRRDPLFQLRAKLASPPGKRCGRGRRDD